MVNGQKIKGKASKGKCGNMEVKLLIKLVLLGSHEKSTSASATFPKITFITSQNADDHLLSGCNVIGTMLKAVCALGS